MKRGRIGDDYWVGKKKAILLLVLLVIVAVGSFVIWSRSREPEYKGKKVSVWLDEWVRPPRGSINATETPTAEDALRGIGPKAIPYIASRLKEEKSFWRKKYTSIYGWFPRKVQRVLPRPKGKFGISEAVDAVICTGMEVSPELVKLLQDDDASVRILAARFLEVLYWKVTDFEPVISSLTGLLKDEDFFVRQAATSALGRFGPKAAPAVPSLIPLLSGPKERSDASGRIVDVRLEAARTLGNIGPKAGSAVPSLMVLLKDPSPVRRTMAARALWKISGDVTNTVPVFAKALDEMDEASKWEAIACLEQMGPKARPAVPALFEQLKGGKRDVADVQANRITLRMITNALVKIDPKE